MQEAIRDKENNKLKILRTNLQELSDIEDKSIEAVDPSYAEAKRFTKKLEKNLDDAFKEKDKFTDEFIKENDKRENKPMYTPEMKKLKLSESLFEDCIAEKKDDMGEVEELDDDMFTYIYDLFTRGNRYNRPDSPIGKKIKAFDYTSKRDALDSGFEITTNINGNIELRSPNPDDFDQAKEVCDELKIQCRTVAPRKWDKEKNYTFEIIVPTDENGDPIARKEFFKEEEIEESLNEDFKLITDLSSYEPWSGAIETMDKINEAGMFDALENYLEEIFPDGATITEVNDLLWFDSETVLADLGIEYPDDEDEEEDEE